MGNIRNILVSVFRDQVWQAVGAILGVIALVISVIVAYDIYHKEAATADVTALTISPRYARSLLSELNETMKGRVTLLIDEVEVDPLYVSAYMIENSGQKPIPPQDFIDPLEVSVEAPWEILSVETGGSDPSDIGVTWTRLTTSTYKMEPLLLNAQDWAEALVYLTYPGEAEALPELKWTGRVVNVKSFSRRPPPEPTRSPFSLFETVIFHSGWSPYLLVGLALSLFIVSVLLGVHCGRLDRSSRSHLFVLTAIAALSFSSAEIITDLLMRDREAYFWYREGLLGQWWGAWFLLGFHLLLLIYLIWPSIRRRARQHEDAAQS